MKMFFVDEKQNSALKGLFKITLIDVIISGFF